MKINKVFVSVKSTKLLSSSLHDDGKMEENGIEFPVNNEVVEWKKSMMLKMMVTKDIMLHVMVLKLVVMSHKDVD